MSSERLTRYRVLTGDDLFTIHEKLYPARTKWLTLGLALSIDYDTLRSIEDECHGNNDKALSEMLAKRLQKGGTLTWEKLCVALRKETVGRNDVAEAIEKAKEDNEKHSAKAGTKRKSAPGESGAESLESQSSCSKKQKLDPAIKKGQIENDLVLMRIGKEIGSKWLEVGVALGMKFSELTNGIGRDNNISNDQKPWHMLQEWQSKAADKFTYETLAAALKEVGLNTCAQTHCYTD